MIPGREPHRLVLIAAWLLATAVLVVVLAQGDRHADRFETLRLATQVVYVAALLWHLGRTGPPTKDLPELSSVLLPRRAIGRALPAVLVALLLAMALATDDGSDNVMLLMMVATLWLLVAWWRRIRLRPVVLGLVVAAIALLGGYPFLRNGFVGETIFVLLPAFVPLMFVAGGLLIERTGLGASPLHAGRPGAALASFGKGCLLFLPLGLVNAAAGSPGSGIDWVTEWWQPFTLPLFSGLTEEVWFRLLLVGLCYLWLRPALRGRPGLAVVATVLFSAIVFGIGHGRDLDHFFTTGLLYGLPMAVAFVRRDWEHAAGAHYAINLVPWVMVYLGS